MSCKLSRWIECEFDRNAWFFGEFKGGLQASCDFIDYVLKDNEYMGLDEEDMKYIETVRSCYSTLKELSNEMLEAIGEYKHAFVELFADEEIIRTKTGYRRREIKRR